MLMHLMRAVEDTSAQGDNNGLTSRLYSIRV